MSNYRRGRSAEHYVKGKLIQKGFKVFRLAGSKPADLVAVSDTRMFLVEVKSYHLSDAALNREGDNLWKLCEGTPMRPLVIHKDKSGKNYEYVEFK